MMEFRKLFNTHEKKNQAEVARTWDWAECGSELEMKWPALHPSSYPQFGSWIPQFFICNKTQMKPLTQGYCLKMDTKKNSVTNYPLTQPFIHRTFHPPLPDDRIGVLLSPTSSCSQDEGPFIPPLIIHKGIEWCSFTLNIFGRPVYVSSSQYHKYNYCIIFDNLILIRRFTNITLFS